MSKNTIIMTRTYLMLICFMYGVHGHAQTSSKESPYQYLHLENKQVYFEKVYQLDSVDSAGMEKFLTVNIPRVKNLNDFDKNGEVITGTLKNVMIDYKKYGGKHMSSAIYLNYPFFANVSIIWKDSKYKVTVTNMYFHLSKSGIISPINMMTGDETFTHKRGNEWHTNKTVVKAGEYVEKYLADLFLINAPKSDW